MTVLVNVWSGPRNVSTALMYAFRQRSDTTVVDEPLYAAYLATHPELASHHPGHEAVLASQPQDWLTVVRRLLGGDWPTPVVVAKQMAAHLDGVDLGWLDAARNVILLRAPEPVVASYTEQVEAVAPAQLGYEVQAELLHRALDRDETPIVLETSRLLADPRGVLTRCCELLGLPFEDAMLSWPAGPTPEDGVWAPHWYAATHRSTGFAAPRERDIQLTSEQAAVAAACRPYYERLAAHAL